MACVLGVFEGKAIIRSFVWAKAGLQELGRSLNEFLF